MLQDDDEHNPGVLGRLSLQRWYKDGNRANPKSGKGRV